MLPKTETVILSLAQSAASALLLTRKNLFLILKPNANSFIFPNADIINVFTWIQVSTSEPSTSSSGTATCNHAPSSVPDIYDFDYEQPDFQIEIKVLKLLFDYISYNMFTF